MLRILVFTCQNTPVLEYTFFHFVNLVFYFSEDYRAIFSFLLFLLFYFFLLIYMWLDSAVTFSPIDWRMEQHCCFSSLCLPTDSPIKQNTDNLYNNCCSIAIYNLVFIDFKMSLNFRFKNSVLRSVLLLNVRKLFFKM